MLYLNSFYLPDADTEWDFRMTIKLTSYTSIYPFYVFPQKGISELHFRPLTILYGGNGSGKSTLLNVIAEKLGLTRETPFNRTDFFADYVKRCRCSLDERVPAGSRIITSDDVFDFMLSLRELNDGVDKNKRDLLEDYFELKRDRFKISSLEDYEKLKKRNSARRKTASAFIREQGMSNIREQSNGESALYCFTNYIADDTLCLLDEPENSLSAAKQLELAELLTDCVRYCGDQIIMATHSPFLLALEDARIIDLDNGGRIVDSWTELENVRIYRDFFEVNREDFKK